MNATPMRRAVLRGSGSASPSRLVPNSFFDDRFGAGVGDWLVKHLAIRQRYWLTEDESIVDLASQAAEQAMAEAGVAPDEVSLLVISTDTPEYLSPSTASLVQHRLGLTHAGTFDLNAACAGFVTALDLAAKYIAADPQYKHIVVVGAYAMSRHLNPDDKKTVTLFADGASAVVLSASDDPADAHRGWLGGSLHTKGEFAEWMGIYAGGSAKPVNAERLSAHEHQLVFARKFPKELNPATWEPMVRSLCDTLGITPADVDHYVFTQLNIGSIHETLDALGVPHDRAPTVMQTVGYTGSACIPMALHHARAQGKVQPGDLVFFVASGGGLSFAAGALRA